MAKDYAKYTYKNKRRLLVSGWRSRLLSVVFLLMFIVIAGAGWFVWKHHAERITTFYASLQSYLHHNHQEIEVKNNVESSPKPEVQFHFYTELPKMQVVLPSPDLTSQTPQKDQYVVQIGVFQHAREASEMRITLLLAGFEVSLIKTEAGYILQDGPYHNISDAKRMQAALKKKGYENTTVAPL